MNAITILASTGCVRGYSSDDIRTLGDQAASNAPCTWNSHTVEPDGGFLATLLRLPGDNATAGEGASWAVAAPAQQTASSSASTAWRCIFFYKAATPAGWFRPTGTALTLPTASRRASARMSIRVIWWQVLY